MKSAAAIAILMTSITLFSQDCSSYFFLQDNKTIEMAIINGKGQESGRMIYKVSNANSSSSTVNSEFIDPNGKSITKSANNVKCVNGVMMMDMKMFVPSGQEASGTATDVYLEYPGLMNVGDLLKDGQFNMDVEAGNGLKSNIDISITDRKVEAKEKVTTPAGTWECFKITSKNKITSKMSGIGVPIRSDVTEWFAPGFGVVRTESKSGKTEITSIK